MVQLCFPRLKIRLEASELTSIITCLLYTSSELYTRITALEKSDAKRDEQYGKILDKLNDMQADINKALLSIAEFKEKSGKRWDKIVDKILLLVITACVGYILIKFGLPV